MNEDGNIPLIEKNEIVFISGPMTGKPLFNYPAFYGYAGLIEKEFGCRVLNPARQPNGLDYAEYIRRALADVESATVIFLLDGWQQSPGAQLEFYTAYKKGLDIIYENQLEQVIERRFAHNG